MKKIQLFLFPLFLACMSMPLFAQNRSEKAQNPLNYPYYIYGEQTVTGKNSATLSNIKYKGFSSEIPEDGETYGKRNTEEKFVYEFKNIQTHPEINLDNKKLLYWRQLEGGVWMSDAESGNATARLRMDKDAYFILVLDCSFSLGNEFTRVKEGARTFIEQMYQVSDQGNLKIGVVCFSSMENTEIFPMTELTPANRSKMLSFISGQNNSRKATAMYYAINEGIDKMLPDGSDINADKFEGIHIITFTDGLDNTSQLEKEQMYTVNEVRRYVESKMRTTSIKNNSLDSWVIGVQGTDVQNAQLELMKNQLTELASDRSQFIWLEDMSQLVSTFSNIANSLTKRWKNMYCTSALNHAGAVCWTLGDITEPVKPVVKAPRKRKDILLGVNAGVGYGMEDLNVTAGVDFAYPLSSKFGLGAYISVGSFPTLGTNLGILATIGDHNKSKLKFMCGIGGHSSDEGAGVDARLGLMFRNGLYLMADIYCGARHNYNDGDNGGYYEYNKYGDYYYEHDEYGGYYGDNEFIGGITINIGFNFGKLFK